MDLYRTTQPSVGHVAHELVAPGDPLAFAMRRIAAAILGPGDRDSGVELKAAEMMTKRFAAPYRREQLSIDIATASSTDLERDVAALNARMNASDRDLVIRFALELCVLCDLVDSATVEILETLTRGLDVSGEHIGETLTHLGLPAS